MTASGIIQATRHPMNFARFSGDVISGNGTIAAWPTAYVKMLLRSNQSGGVAWRHIFPVASFDDHWHQIEHAMGFMGGGNGGIKYEFRNAAGEVIFRMGATATPTIQYWTGTGTTYTTFATLPALSGGFVVYTFTWRYYRANPGILECYVNGTLVGGFYGNTIIGSGPPKYVDMYNNSTGTGAGNIDYWTGGVVSNGATNPYGIKIATLRPNGAGTNSGFTGAYTAVDDDAVDTSDIISAAAGSLKSTFAMEDPPALTGSDRIVGIYHSMYARRGNSGPTDAYPIIRASGVDQAGPTVSLSTGWKAYNNMFDSNSVTTDEFTTAEVTAGEVGVGSV